ncbi:MAG: HNH endonuclease [Synechococcaceae cyanobacterium SM2_3_1]|nr:HNH endonuclease [Synechococcaceae cyanobacterium SM2_3_1]
MSTSGILETSVIVFSQAYLPLSRISMRRAIVLLISGRAEPVHLFHGKRWTIHSAHQEWCIAEHIRLTFHCRERSWKVPPVTRREVAKRDGGRCQYCGCTNNMTLDHVVPLSRGGVHRWENVVLACESCNQRKGDRTPADAGMILRSMPKPPVHPVMQFANQVWQEAEASGSS